MAGFAMLKPELPPSPPTDSAKPDGASDSQVPLSCVPPCRVPSEPRLALVNCRVFRPLLMSVLDVGTADSSRWHRVVSAALRPRVAQSALWSTNGPAPRT